MDSISHVAPFESTGTLEKFYNADGPSVGASSELGWEERLVRVEDYSDLEYQQIDVTLTTTYSFTDRLYTTAMATYSDFSSDEDYVYGDEDGTAYYGFLGVGYRY